MKKNSFLKVFLGFSALSLMLAGCGSSGGHNNDPRYHIYELAKDAGYSGTYEEWLESIKGEDGKDGLTPYIGENGNWWIGDLDTGVPAKGQDAADLNPQGLDFFPLDDGTYGVGFGTSLFLSKIVVPETYNGKAVTTVVDYGFAYDKSGEIPVREIVLPHTITTIKSYG